MSGSSTMKKKTARVAGGPKPVTDELTVAEFNATANCIGGTTADLQRMLKELEQDLKKDMEGRKEYEDYLKLLNIKKAELEKRVSDNKKWIESFESQNSDRGNFETQYKSLVDSIGEIYKGAKDFHGKGIDMLIKEFAYHPLFKHHDDRFTGIPYNPK